jgi:hypothetical protein
MDPITWCAIGITAIVVLYCGGEKRKANNNNSTNYSNRNANRYDDGVSDRLAASYCIHGL